MPDELRPKMLAAAYLRSQGWNLKEIGQRLGVPLSSVGRMVQKATAEGVLVTTFARERLTEKEWTTLQDLVPSDLQRLVDKSSKGAGVSPPQVHIYPSPTRRTTGSAWVERLTRFGIEAAPQLSRLLRNSSVCGVSWGETLMSVIERLPVPKRRRGPSTRSTTFVPVVGDVLDWGPTKASSSSLAQRLDEIVNGDYQHDHSCSLAAIPALIPHDFDETEARTIRRMVERSKAFRNIFGSPGGGLIQRLDTLITSVGPVDHPLGWQGRGLLHAAGLTPALLRNMILGDVSGVLLRRSNVRPEDAHLFATIQRRWTGIQEDHLIRCRRRAEKLGTAGLIVLAIGASKARPVAELIRRGLASHLLIDADLADGLRKILTAPL